MDGSGSRDPEGKELAFLWEQTSGPGEIVLAGGTTARPTFTPERQGVYVFRLTVNDGTYDSAPDFTEVQVQAGAEAGCGCGVSVPGGKAGSTVPLLLLLAGVLGLRFRRATYL